jgi:hypothetical protein
MVRVTVVVGATILVPARAVMWMRVPVGMTLVVMVRFDGRRLVAVARMVAWVMVCAVALMRRRSVASAGAGVVMLVPGRPVRPGWGRRRRARSGWVGPVPRVVARGGRTLRPARSRSLGAAARVGGMPNGRGTPYGERSRMGGGRCRRGGVPGSDGRVTRASGRRVDVLGIHHLVDHGCNPAAGMRRSDTADKHARKQGRDSREQAGQHQRRPRRRRLEATIDCAYHLAAPVGHPGGARSEMRKAPSSAEPRAGPHTTRPPRTGRAYAHRNRLPARHDPGGFLRLSPTVVAAAPTHHPPGMEQGVTSSTHPHRTVMDAPPLRPNLIATGHTA